MPLKNFYDIFIRYSELRKSVEKKGKKVFSTYGYFLWRMLTSFPGALVKQLKRVRFY